MAQVEEDCIVLSDVQSDAGEPESISDSGDKKVPPSGQVSEDLGKARQRRRKRVRSEGESTDSDTPGTPRSENTMEKKITPATRLKKPVKSQQVKSGLITSFFKFGEANASTNKSSPKTEKKDAEGPSSPKTNTNIPMRSTFSIFKDDSARKNLSTGQESLPDMPLSHDGKVVGHIASKLKDHQVIIDAAIEFL
jgi:hypothetical protein